MGLVCAVGTSLAPGFGSVLQAMAARATDATTHQGPRLLLRLMPNWRYLLGLALDGIGFVLSLVALRWLPLYVVQSVVASFLAVTAVAGAVLLETRVRRPEQIALFVVIIGLVLVSLSAAPQPGWVPAAAVGLTLAVAGALFLSRSGK